MKKIIALLLTLASLLLIGGSALANGGAEASAFDEAEKSAELSGDELVALAIADGYTDAVLDPYLVVDEPIYIEPAILDDYSVEDPATVDPYLATEEPIYHEPAILVEKSGLVRGNNAPIIGPPSWWPGSPYNAVSGSGGITSYTYTDVFFTGVSSMATTFTGHVGVGGTMSIRIRLFDMDLGTYGGYVGDDQTLEGSSWTASAGTLRSWGSLTTSHRYFFRIQVDSRSLSGSTLIIDPLQIS
jgi:hypothetical protein